MFGLYKYIIYVYIPFVETILFALKIESQKKSDSVLPQNGRSTFSVDDWISRRDEYIYEINHSILSTDAALAG